jgi:hypothetical protein
VLSEHERMIWDEIERNYQAEADEAARGRLGLWTGAGRSGPRGDLPAVVVGGGWAAVLLVLFGVPSAGAADQQLALHWRRPLRRLPEVERPAGVRPVPLLSSELVADSRQEGPSPSRR